MDGRIDEYSKIDITSIFPNGKRKRSGKAIAAKLCKSSSYQNLFFARRTKDMQEELIILPKVWECSITVNDGPRGEFQLFPICVLQYVCIDVFNSQHVPVKIEKIHLSNFWFCKTFPHYFLDQCRPAYRKSSSILSHDHFPGGHYTFTNGKSTDPEKCLDYSGYEEWQAGIVKWPLSVLSPS